ncbi:MAG: Gfo/Idh/MocA family oxidoreductase [Pseudarthrobacter sp.]|nr:Gfo/Idh/MocA family oxidoreductase [Pseudarthrobacter sp.]
MTQHPATAAPGKSAAPAAVPRIALVGVHGFGERHLANLARLQEAGRLELAAVADPSPPRPGTLADAVAVFPDLGALLAAQPDIDVAILATPIQTHAPLAIAALSAGMDVFVEKPPVASLSQFNDVLAAARNAGRLVQVGFQSLGSAALPALAGVVGSGEIGDVLGLSATGQWVRSKAYFNRSRWAGKRSLDGVDVVDGVATNALAHAVATALHVAGARTLADVVSVETDLYRAHDTESDDTSVLRIRTAHGTTLLCALTLCGPEQLDPSITVHGTLGDVTLYYTRDELVFSTAHGERRRTFGRTDLLEDLLEARSTGGPLLCALEDTGAFTAVLEAIRTSPAPAPIGAAHVTWEGEDDDAHPVVTGIADLMERAAKAQATFAELGVPWARHLPPARTLTLDGRPVAEYQDGSHIRAVSSPRPYLHPVRTLGGTVVTDHQPLDHVWHLGVGIALQDVDGVNFWGGRTYTRDAGQYTWRPDHGSIAVTGTGAAETAARSGGAAGKLQESLSWNGPDGAPLLREERTWAWSGVAPSIWRLCLDFVLSPAGDKPVSLGSPGSNGRFEGGYGGFFWRLPACANATVWTADGTGESETHGSSARWLAWSGKFDAGPATLVFVAPEGSTDPWFVRVDGYPGVGQSLAWDTPVIAEPGSPVRRQITVFVADGCLATTDIEALIDQQGDRS